MSHHRKEGVTHLPKQGKEQHSQWENPPRAAEGAKVGGTGREGAGRGRGRSCVLSKSLLQTRDEVSWAEAEGTEGRAQKKAQLLPKKQDYSEVMEED